MSGSGSCRDDLDSWMDDMPEQAPSQPLAAGGETWTAKPEPIHGWVVYGDGRVIASGIYREEDARQIITDHARAALVEQLVAALIVARDWWQGESIDGDDLDYQFPLSDIENAINAVRKEREG